MTPYITYVTIGAMVGAFVPMAAAWETKRWLGEASLPAEPEDLAIIMVLSLFFWPFVLGAVMHTLSQR